MFTDPGLEQQRLITLQVPRGGGGPVPRFSLWQQAVGAGPIWGLASDPGRGKEDMENHVLVLQASALE